MKATYPDVNCKKGKLLNRVSKQELETWVKRIVTNEASVSRKNGTDVLIILLFINYNPLSAQSLLSRFLYPIASAICWLCTCSLPSKSAMVLATFKIRL